MFCSNCGNEVNENAVVCIHCGCAIDSSQARKRQQAENDNGGIGWWVLGCIFPFVGLIMYLLFLGNRPKSAKRAGSGALTGLAAEPLLASPAVIIALCSGSVPYGCSFVMLALFIPSIVFVVLSAKGVRGALTALFELLAAFVISIPLINTGFLHYAHTGLVFSLITVAISTITVVIGGKTAQ